MLIWPTPKPAVKTAIEVLAAGFSGYASVSTKLPRKGLGMPERFVKISRVGGGQDHPATDIARLLVECFGKDTATAENMCNTARAVLRNSAGATIDGVFIRGWSGEQGPVDFPHPDLLEFERWQLHGDFAVKAN